jgi:NAD(P)H-dependent FMN reductase
MGGYLQQEMVVDATKVSRIRPTSKRASNGAEEFVMVVAVLQGSVRSERMGDRVAKWAMAQLTTRGHEAVLVDAAALDLPLLDTMWKEIKDSPEEHRALYAKLAPLAKLYERVDGYCVLGAEYNHSVAPALSNLIDCFLEEYFYRPSAIVCYSSTPFGGVRAAMQLRALLAEVGMSSIPSLQPIPAVGTALSAEGVALTQALAEKSGKFWDEFEWYMRALKSERAKGN